LVSNFCRLFDGNCRWDDKLRFLVCCKSKLCISDNKKMLFSTLHITIQTTGHSPFICVVYKRLMNKSYVPQVIMIRKE
jgi:hypothetical protein